MRAKFLVAIVLLLAAFAGAGSGAVAQKKPNGVLELTRQLVLDFVDAYNDGDLSRLDGLFAQQEDFGAYRLSPERDWPSSQDRSTLIPYFRERHELGDHFKLTNFTINRERGAVPSNMWGFGYAIERTSSDVMPWGSGTVKGKGAADCTIVNWNAGWSP